MSNKIFKQKAHNCFESNLGNTKGLHSPSECGGFWYRRLNDKENLGNINQITDEVIRRIRYEITSVINHYNKPLVIGNNNVALRIGLIKKIFQMQNLL